MIQFSQNAMKEWNKIPSNTQNKLLSHMFCSHYKQAVTVNFTAQIIDDNLLLSKIFKTCDNKENKLIENNL